MPEFVKRGLIRVSGNLYLKASHVVLWFRSEHSDWSLETEIVTATEDFALVKATVRDESGRILATGHKSCARAAFPAGYVEKAESGAVARALGFLGYGTEYGELESDETVPAASYARPVAPEPAGPITEDQRRAIVHLCQKNGVVIPENLESMTAAQGAQLLSTLQKR
jgi:hypothetical protein